MDFNEKGELLGEEWVREKQKTAVAWGERPERPRNFARLGFARAACVETGYGLEEWSYAERVKRRMLEK